MVAETPPLKHNPMIPLPRPALITANGGVRCWSCGRRIGNVVSVPYDLDCRCGSKNADSDKTIA